MMYVTSAETVAASTRLEHQLLNSSNVSSPHRDSLNILSQICLLCFTKAF